MRIREYEKVLYMSITDGGGGGDGGVEGWRVLRSPREASPSFKQAFRVRHRKTLG